MTYDPDKHHRRSIRLKNYDYASVGMYFVTICAQNRASLFGNVVQDDLKLNEAGQMVQTVWETLPERFPNIEMDEFVVMPNHFHGILVIHNNVGVSFVDTKNRTSTKERAPTRDAPTPADLVGAPLVGVGAPNIRPTLGDMIGAFKSITTHQYIQGVRQKEWPPFDRRLWQRNYWEHIIRNNESLDRIRQYIQNNPVSWIEDKLHPDAPPFG